MKNNFAIAIILTSLLAGCSTASTPARLETKSTTAQPTLPALPAGVTELKFSEFFATPVGPRGLTLADKLLSLDGKRVRMLGYMVHHDAALPGQFLFSALPVQLHDHDSSDDLPAAVVHVSVPTCLDKTVPFAPGLMLLTGTLAVGAREEADGRMSMFRLALDAPQAARSSRAASTRKGAEQLLVRAAPQSTAR